jgi:hypothetical protein
MHRGARSLEVALVYQNTGMERPWFSSTTVAAPTTRAGDAQRRQSRRCSPRVRSIRSQKGRDQVIDIWRRCLSTVQARTFVRELRTCGGMGFSHLLPHCQAEQIDANQKLHGRLPGHYRLVIAGLPKTVVTKELSTQLNAFPNAEHIHLQRENCDKSSKVFICP